MKVKADDVRRFGSIEEFRQAAKDAPELLADAHVRSSFDTEVKAGEGEDSRTLTFAISSASRPNRSANSLGLWSSGHCSTSRFALEQAAMMANNSAPISTMRPSKSCRSASFI